MPPSAMTVWALPSSDLRNHSDGDAGGGSFNGGAQSGAARADHQHVVVSASGIRPLKNSPVVPDAHAAKADVKIGKPD